MDYPADILEIAARLGYEPAAVYEARSLPHSELNALTDAYLTEAHQSPAYWRLKPARDLAAPDLIAAFELGDPFKRNKEGFTDTPASRALAFLDNGVHASLKMLLLR